jgi:hypothetical protein
MFFEVTDQMMEIPIDVNDEDDLKRAADCCLACFESYTFYLKLKEMEKPEPEIDKEELVPAKILLKKMTATLWRIKAIMEMVLIAFWKFIRQIGLMFKGNLSMELNRTEWGECADFIGEMYGIKRLYGVVTLNVKDVLCLWGRYAEVF